MAASLEVMDLRKSFGAVRALDGIRFAVEPGEVFGYLGPNGAGKTTTLRVIAGLVHPDEGEVRLLGRSHREAGAREAIGYLPGELALYGRMRAGALLDHFARFRPGRPPTLRETLLEVLGVGPEILSRKVKFLSHGTKQKIGIIVAMQHDPELVLLDEPTLGLDPLVQERFRWFLREYAARGRAVVFSSHVLPEVETLCRRVAILREGKIVVQESIESLRRTVVRRMILHYREAAPHGLESIRGVLRVERSGRDAVVFVRGDLRPLLAELSGHDLEDLAFPEPELEDVFLTWYRGASGG